MCVHTYTCTCTCVKKMLRHRHSCDSVEIIWAAHMLQWFHYVDFLQCSPAKLGLCVSVSVCQCVCAILCINIIVAALQQHQWAKNYQACLSWTYTLYNVLSTRAWEVVPCMKVIEQPCHEVSGGHGSSSSFRFALAHVSPTAHHQHKWTVVYTSMQSLPHSPSTCGHCLSSNKSSLKMMVPYPNWECPFADDLDSKLIICAFLKR
jgi:hypothetical protein